MGIPAPIGVAGLLANPAGDLANYVASGQLTAAGPGTPYQCFGPFNLVLYASINTTLTTTANSATATVGSGTGLAAGVSVKSVNVPPGTTYGAFSGTSGTLAFPTVTLAGLASSNAAQIIGLSKSYALATLLGATVTGPNIPTGTTVTGVSASAGFVNLSNAPTASSPTPVPQFFSFALGPACVTAGADTKAIFTGSAIAFVGTVNVERSFDGGYTWIVANTGSGTIAQFASGPVSLSFGEPERGVLYRVNCIGYTSGTINYRFSTTGAAAGTGGYNQLT